MNVQTLLEKLARIDTDGQSAEHVANLAVQYAIEARELLKRFREPWAPVPEAVQRATLRKLSRRTKR